MTEPETEKNSPKDTIEKSEQKEETDIVTAKCGNDTVEVKKGTGSNYKYYDKMDENNKKGMDVLATTNDWDKTAKYMMTDQKTGRQLSYSEMRSRYG